MIWRRMSVDSDGCLNGDRRYGFRQNRVPGAEANLTTISRNSHNPRPVDSCSPPPRTPLHDYCTAYSHDFKRDESVGIYSASHENTRRTTATHSTPLYVIPFISWNISVPHPWPLLAIHSLRFLHLLSYTALLACSHTFIRFDTLRLPPHAATIIPSCIVLLTSLFVAYIPFHSCAV